MRSRNADAVSIARWIIKPVTADVSQHVHWTVQYGQMHAVALTILETVCRMTATARPTRTSSITCSARWLTMCIPCRIVSKKSNP
jgi:hypothetical protein